MHGYHQPRPLRLHSARSLTLEMGNMNDPLLERTVHHLRLALQGRLRNVVNGRNKRSIGLPEAFWTTGQTLRLSFLGTPDEALKQQIFTIASQWLDHANLSFVLTENDQLDAEIVIRTDAEETLNQSDYGRHRMLADGETMILGIKLTDPDFHSTVLHEFGHALGLFHEHQHPDANIPWDRAALRRHIAARFSDQERAWHAFDKTLERLIRQNYDPITYEPRITLRYDRRSIMHYPIRQAHTLGDCASGWSHELSAKDKQFMRMIYPGKGSPDLT